MRVLSNVIARAVAMLHHAYVATCMDLGLQGTELHNSIWQWRLAGSQSRTHWLLFFFFFFFLKQFVFGFILFFRSVQVIFAHHAIIHTHNDERLSKIQRVRVRSTSALLRTYVSRTSRKVRDVTAGGTLFNPTAIVSLSQYNTPST